MAKLLSKDQNPIPDVSKCVLNMIELVSNFLGVSFKSHEQQAWELFTALERDGSERGLK